MSTKIGIVLDVDFHIENMERICSKYVDIPEGLLFISGYRYPIVDKSRFHVNSNKLFKNEPFYPYVCMGLLERLVQARLMGKLDRDAFNDFKSNRLLPCGGKCFTEDISDGLGGLAYEDEIISSTLIGITQEDMDSILTSLSLIMKQIDHYVGDDVTHIYTLSTDTKYIILEKHGDISSFRFREACEQIEINTRCEDE